MTLADECGYSLLVNELTRAKWVFSSDLSCINCRRSMSWMYKGVPFHIQCLGWAEPLRWEFCRSTSSVFHSCSLLENTNFRNNHNKMEITLTKFETPNNLIFGCGWYWIEERITFTIYFSNFVYWAPHPLSCWIRLSKILIRTLHRSFQDPFAQTWWRWRFQTGKTGTERCSF